MVARRWAVRLWVAKLSVAWQGPFGKLAIVRRTARVAPSGPARKPAAGVFQPVTG
jgi:hypothetical protein